MDRIEYLERENKYTTDKLINKAKSGLNKQKDPTNFINSSNPTR